MQGCLVALFPMLCIRYVIAKCLVEVVYGPYLAAIATAAFGVWFVWHGGTVQNASSPLAAFWGLVPALMIEVECFLRTKKNLIRDCVKRSNNRFVMSDGSVIILIPGLVWCAVAAAIITATAIWAISPPPQKDLFAALHWPLARVLLTILGVLGPVDVSTSCCITA